MATHRIPIFGHGTVPDTSGNVFMEPFAVKAVNDVWDRLVTIFADTSTRDGLHGGFQVPQNYVGTANLVIPWCDDGTAGNDVEFDFDYRAVAIGESLDQSGSQESVNGNSTADTVAFEWVEATIPLTDANFAAGDEVEFTLFRDGVDAGDTLANEAIVFGAYFEFDDA